MRQAFLAVAALGFAILFIRAAGVGIAGDYLDPIAKISVQDEALYAHSAIRIAERGDWPTPRFLDGFALFEPPLTVWLAGAAAKLAGISRLTLRLPIISIAALGLGVLFLFAAEITAWPAGIFAVALLLSNRLWMVPASMVLPDGLLASFEIAAMYCLLADPWLESPWAFWGFAVSFAAAVLAKGIAAAPLALAFALYCVLAPARRRPAPRRALAALAAAAVLALPWYTYQATAHAPWFSGQAEIEFFTLGAGALPHSTQENHAMFYLKRLIWIDPVLFALFVTAAPAWLTAVRKRSAEATLLACWVAPMLAALFLWKYRDATYLIPCLAPIAVAAAVYAPLPNRSARWTAAVLAAAFVMKLATPGAPWGLSYAGGTIQSAARPLQAYCRLARGNELIVVDLVDHLYASTLPLACAPRAIGLRPVDPDPRDGPGSGETISTGCEGISSLRYALVGPPGLAVSDRQFDNLKAWAPRYRTLPRQGGVASAEPLPRLIMAATPAQLMDLVRAQPLTDFFLPERYRAAAEAVNGAAHDWDEAPPDYFLLLARQRLPRAVPPAWTCGM